MLASNSECRRAFTLLELMVVIGIIGILLGLTLPAMMGLSKANALNTGGRAVSNILSSARSEAINQRRLVQVRIATKWMNGGTEDTSSSYRKFSVWRRPQPDDAQQANAGSDPYVQMSKWETLPAGIIFENDPSVYNFPASPTDSRYPGTLLFDASLNNRKASITTANSTVDVAWIEFGPSGSATVGGSTPGRVYLLLIEGFWNGTSSTTTNQRANWLASTVDTLMGRSTVLRP